MKYFAHPQISRFLALSFALLVPVVLAVPQPQAHARASCPDMGKLISHGAYSVANVSGRVTAGCNQDEALVPASIIKVATVLAAMRTLGPNFRFKTEFYRDKAGNFYIRGLGDPSLVSEEISQITERLQAGGLRKIPVLFVDDSAFQLEGPIPGQTATDNPYDAPVAALAVNFNSIAILKTKTGDIASGEVQTPTIPLMHEMAAKRKPGRHRLNVCPGCADPYTRSARHAAEIFRAFFQRQGVTVGKLGGVRTVPADAELMMTHKSGKNLTQISTDLMRSSSNYIANLIFLQAGAKKYGFPATWQKARRAMNEELAVLLGDQAKKVHMVEGSGLSRENRISARNMLALLQRFRPYREVLKEKDGLSKKSGTLTGVYNLAGYLPNGSAYVIMLNQEANTRDAVLARMMQGTQGK